ncbi:MAG: acyl-CoA dehydrogenase family protein [Halieaceae bacterium]|jgi:alkylation response protein AidB-like acyl-CoA dehydrogenase|nr:acyl-CoA dehydrogenase family protein [Halieaceae bacterium]
MNFNFTEDQTLFRDSVREFLRNEVTPDYIRQRWEGKAETLWPQLAEMGLTGVTVPEAHGGLGMGLADFVLLAEECGYVALPEPLTRTAMVAVPLLSQAASAREDAGEWLAAIASGELIAAVGLENALVEDADRAGLLLIQQGEQMAAVLSGEFSAEKNESVDPSRQLFSVAARGGESLAVSSEHALDLGALACAAESLGLAQRMVDMTVAYTADRQQFGKPVGSFQAVKHHMADVAVKLEYARGPVYRAAWALDAGADNASVYVSHAKLAAAEAAALAAKNSIQCHGAMGYTWEVDLHIYMKRAWALAGAWGDTGHHKQRIGNALFEQDLPLGAGATF